jgi:hypothetical protein
MTATLDALLDPGRPAVEYGEIGPTGAGTLGALSDATTVVRVLRGTHARTAADLFGQLSAALQLPAGTGNSWSAMEDRLRDFVGSGSNVLLVVVETEALLADAGEDELAGFVSVIEAVDDEGREEGGGRARLLLTEAMNGLWRIRPRLETLGRPVALADFGV